MIGLGCVVGAIGVSLFYKASNLAEFQAIADVAYRMAAGRNRVVRGRNFVEETL